MKDRHFIIWFAAVLLVITNHAYSNQLKKEAGWEHVQANCSGCHSLQLVTSNRGDRKIWLNLIRWMQKEHNLWKIQPESEEIILSYLSSHYASSLPMRRRPLTKDQLPKG